MRKCWVKIIIETAWSTVIEDFLHCGCSNLARNDQMKQNNMFPHVGNSRTKLVKKKFDSKKSWYFLRTSNDIKLIKWIVENVLRSYYRLL